MKFSITHGVGANEPFSFHGEFAAGERVALLGQSGAGKTTLLRYLAGLVKSANCSVSVDGQVIHNAWLANVTLVAQQPIMFAHHRVKQTIAYGSRYNVVSQLPVQSWIERLEITAMLNKRCSELSGGEAQRVALLRALATGRKWLLLDEAFSAMDTQRATAACDVIAEYCQLTGAGLVLASHQDSPQRYLCESAYRIHNKSGEYSADLFSVLNHQDQPETVSTLVVNVEGLEHDFLATTLGDQVLYCTKPNMWVAGKARVSIAANDISLAINREHDTSMVNRLGCTISSISRSQERVRVTLALNSQTFCVDISRWSLDRLQLTVNQKVFAEFKVGAVQWHGQANV